MKTILITAAAGLGLLALLVAPSGAGNDGGAADATPALPESLASLYPPASPGPVYLMEMIAMGTSFSGIITDFGQNDLENARAGFRDFKARYDKLAPMVPEWRNDFPTAPVEELGRALETGDGARLMKAAEAVGAACHSCHVRSMPAAYYRFHWGDFGALTATDPLSGQDVPFAVLMRMIESDFSAVGNDLKEGQTDHALAHLEGFKQRYQALKTVCAACHDSERHYYVDGKVMKMIDDLRPLLSAKPVNAEAVGALLRGIGKESCSKCHLVHVPAAYAAHK